MTSLEHITHTHTYIEIDNNVTPCCAAAAAVGLKAKTLTSSFSWPYLLVWRHTNKRTEARDFSKFSDRRHFSYRFVQICLKNSFFVATTSTTSNNNFTSPRGTCSCDEWFRKESFSFLFRSSRVFSALPPSSSSKSSTSIEVYSEFCTNKNVNLHTLIWNCCCICILLV